MAAAEAAGEVSDAFLDRYRAFLESKAKLAPAAGFEIDASEVHPALKPHQRDIVVWKVRGGRRATFARFGLGKTLIQLETTGQILTKLGGGHGLIVCPLGVRQEFMRDAKLLGLTPTFIRSHHEVDHRGIYLTNYESVRDGKLDPAAFDVASLDEASVLRSFGSKTFSELLFGAFQRVPYRFAATATPDPNDYVELLAYAQFLGVMDIGQAKTRWFKRDSQHADHLTLYPHKAREFWMWVASWGLFLQQPSDICRCVCHVEGNCSESGSVDSSSRPGTPNPGRGGAAATAGTSTSSRPTTSAQDGSSVADACDQSTAGKVPASTASGEQSSTAAPCQPTRTGATTAVGASGCATDGGSSRTSSPIWDSPHRAQRSTESTTTGTTSPGTVDGQHVSSRHETDGPGVKRHVQGDGEWCDVCRCDEGYALPPMTVRWHEVPSQHETAEADRGGQGRMFKESTYGVSEAAREKRESLDARIAKLLELRAEDPDAHRVIWHDLEDERRAIARAIPDVVSVYGNQDLDEREAAIIAFSDGEIRELSTKPVVAGSGTNFQRHCAWAIFLGIGFKFNDFIQAVHRIQRFLQDRPVRIDLIYTEAERPIRQALEAKWRRYEAQASAMGAILREHGMAAASMAHALTRTLGVERAEITGAGYELVNNDCVIETHAMPADSVDLIVTSLPFSSQYEYTPTFEDFGHTADNAEFWTQMDFLSPELLRVLRPGRVCCVHIKDRVAPGAMTGLGYPTVQPFHAEAIFQFLKHGFTYEGMITVVTDVVAENAQTYRLSWTEQCKDGSRMGAGMPEYILLFRQPPTDHSDGYADCPVVNPKPLVRDADGNAVPWRKELPIIPGTGYSRARWQIDAHDFWRSNGNRFLAPEDLVHMSRTAIMRRFAKYSRTTLYDVEHHVDIGEALEVTGQLSPEYMVLAPQSWHPDVWTDLMRAHGMNTFQALAGREKHLCPLPFDIVDRLIERFSMKGETVYDPFGGLMTVAYRAVLRKRRGRACELSPKYFRDGARYVEREARQADVPTLFDLLESADDTDDDGDEARSA